MLDARATVPEKLESCNGNVPPASRYSTGEVVADSHEVLGHGLNRRQSLNSATKLTLIVSGFHPNATVRPSRIDPTPIVFAKELASLTAIEEHCHAVLGDLLHHLVHALAGMVTISVDQTWFAEHVDLIAFD